MVRTTTDRRINKIDMITVSAVFLLVLLLSLYTPLITDDLHFKHIWNGFDADIGSEVRISSIGNLFTSAGNYYRYSGGRVVCHFFVFAVIYAGKWVFAIINACFFVLAGLLIRRGIGSGLLSENMFLLPLIYMSMFLLLPSWGDSVLWVSGSVNYLWAGTVMLWAVSMIDSSRKGAGNYIVTFISVLLASSVNEVFGGMLIIFIVIRLFSSRIKAAGYYIASLLCTLPGMGLVILSPGNYNRQVMVDGNSDIGIAKVIKTSYDYLSCFISWGSVILLPVLIMLFYMILHREKIKKIFVAMALPIACFAGSVALGLSGVVIQRALFSVILPLMIPAWSCLMDFLCRAEGSEKYKSVYLALASLTLLNLISLSFMQAAVAGLCLVIMVLVRYLMKGGSGRKSGRKPGSPARLSLIVIALSGIIVIFNTVTFFIDVQNYDSYIAEVASAMKRNDMDTVYSASSQRNAVSLFFPAEGTIVSDYSLSWIFQYYVVEGNKI